MKSKTAKKRILISLNLLPVFIFSVFFMLQAPSFSGSEIIAISLAPFFIFIFLFVLIVDFVFLTKFLREARQRPDQPGAKLTLAKVCWLVLIVILFLTTKTYLDFNKHQYAGGRLINSVEAVKLISECKVDDVNVSGGELSLGLRVQKDSSTPPDYVTVKSVDFNKLVEAAKNSAASCGNIDTGVTKNAALNEAIQRVVACQVEIITITDDVGSGTQTSELELSLRVVEHDGIRERVRLVTGLNNLAMIEDSMKQSIPKCGRVPIENYNV